MNIASAIQNFNITNNGSTAINFTGNSISSQFTIAADSCNGMTINPSATCTIGVQFTPTHGGPISSKLIIASNHSDGPHGILLLGEGIGGDHGVITDTENKNIPVNSKLALLITILLLMVFVFWHNNRFSQTA